MSRQTEREWLTVMVAKSPFTCAELSVRLRRHKSYLADYLNRGSPVELDGDDRRALAAIFGVPDPKGPANCEVSPAQMAADIAQLKADVAYLRACAASTRRAFEILARMDSK
jgi:hypothetical protein